MARRAIASLDKDFAQVISHLTAKGILEVPISNKTVEYSKRIHRAAYSLILWRFRLVNLPPHGRPFIEEIASDALQVLPQTLMGYGKTAKLLTRGIIENCLRHIYFFDHPIEFAKMNRDAKWYLKMDDLFDYCKSHPEFLETERHFDAINRLATLYSELSGGVHGRTVADLEMRVALEGLVYDESAMPVHVDAFERCAESANFLLAMFHRPQMLGFQPDEQRIVLNTIASKGRRVWKDLV